MAEKTILGYIECRWCMLLWNRHSLAEVRENSKGNLYVECSGGPDGDNVNCGKGENLPSRHSARLKAMLAKAARGAPEPHAAVEPAPEPDQAPTETTDHGQSSTDDSAGEPQPDPERDGTSGSGFGLL